MSITNDLGQTTVPLSTKMRGLFYGFRSQIHRLPLNTRFRGHNVFEIPVHPDLTDAARTLYRQHVVPRLNVQNGSFQSGDLAFYVNRPAGYGSDISWWSADDVSTHWFFETQFFQKFHLDEPLHGIMDIQDGIRLYSAFFVVRSRCERTRFHMDYTWGCRAQAFTLMTPLEDMSSGDSHLAYIDALGRPRTYQYTLGRAVLFGTSFLHGTQVRSTEQQPRAFLSFTFGSDNQRYWPEIKKSIGHESRLLCMPNGTILYDSQPVWQANSRHRCTAKAST